MNQAIERRQHERFMLDPMYTRIYVRLPDEERFEHPGHAYDVSEGGLQFELDTPIEPGTKIAVQIELPQWRLEEAPSGPGRAVFVFANVVWVDMDEEGPVRMAAVFTQFARQGDHERLLAPMVSRQIRRAA